MEVVNEIVTDIPDRKSWRAFTTPQEVFIEPESLHAWAHSQEGRPDLREYESSLPLQRYITRLLQCSKFPFPMREIRPMVLHLYP